MKADRFREVEAYLTNRMSAEERLRFEQRCEEEPDLGASVDETQILLDGIRYAASARSKEEVLAQLQRYTGGEEEREATRFEIGRFTRSKQMNWSMVAIAASALLLIGLGLFLFNNVRPASPDQIFAEYYETFPNLEVRNVRGSQSQLDQRWQAYRAYDQEDFEEAERLLGDWTSSEAGTDADLFYLALTQMELNKWESALQGLQKVDEAGGKYAMEAKWYMGLTYLKLDQKEKAKAALQEVLHTAQDQSVKAANALEKLN